MKKFIVPLLFCLLAQGVLAQVKWGPRIGISTSELATQDFDLRTPGTFNNLALGIKDAKYGIQIGAFAQFKLLKFFYLQPEVLFNSNRVDYRVTHFSDGGGFTEIVKEKYQYLDIPVLLGLKLGPFRAGIGPVGKVYLSSSSGLTDFQGIKEDFGGLEVAYQAAVGLNLGRLILDLKFDRSLTNFGSFIEVDSRPFDFKEQDRRMVFSLGYAF